ncbi:MAG TPA: hypothetical protein VHG91_18935, partial [Longimicrobium sp.]|nr:hypothetical protein [Longimicrobium sp.]
MRPSIVRVGPPVAGPPPPLVPGIDLHIIACLRHPPDKVGETVGRCYGVRWAARPDWGFPPSGFRVWRRPVQSQVRTPVGTFFLPATTDWPSFRRDAEARRPVCGGPYFPTIEEENLGFLLPLVRLADPRTPVAEHDELTAKAAAFFGDPHTADAELAWALWRYDPPPPLPLLLASPVTAGPVVAYYRERTVEYLLTLALRFEYAALLGLGTDDPAPGDDPLVYGVEAAWAWAAGEAESAPAPTNKVCAPPPPDWVRAERVPGTVAHPVSTAWPTGWTPPPELAPLDAEGKPLPAAALVPRAPCAHTALAWAPPPPEPKLIGHGPVLYLVSRFAHGAATAARKSTPALGPGAVFAPLVVGEYVVRPATEPHFLDLPGMAWPPLEGHYTYEVRGVDLLGALSEPARASLRHHDDLAPPAPRAAARAGPALALAAGGLVTVPLSLRWDAAEDFAGPDAADFRVAARWVPQVTVPVALTAVADVDLLHADVTVASLAGAVDAYAGGRLCVPGADYPIVSHTAGAGAVLRVRKLSGGRMPAAGSDGTVQAMGAATPTTRVARLPRRPAAAAMVAAVGATDPLEVTLSPSGTATLPAGEPARVYLHLLRASSDAEPLGGLRWRLAAPEAGSAARELWDAWLALPDPAGVLAGSPALVFPEHALGVTLRAPTGFGAGLLVLAVTAADGAEYVSSPAMAAADPSLAALHGNEGAAAEVVLSLRSEVAPARAAVPAWVPETRLWATSAAAYAEEATYDLTWTAAP